MLCDDLAGELAGRESKREEIYGGFARLYGRNQHNILKQLSSNEKTKIK